MRVWKATDQGMLICSISASNLAYFLCQVLLNQRFILPKPGYLIYYPDDLCRIIPSPQHDHIFAQRVSHECLKLLSLKGPTLKLQALLRCRRECGVVGWINSSEVPLGGDMRPHKTTDCLTKPQRAQIVLSNNFMPHSTHRDGIVRRLELLDLLG